MSNMPASALRLNPFWSGWPSGPLSRLTVYWLIFAVSISAFVISVFLADRIPALGMMLEIIGLVPCGFSWLFARALFRPRTKSEYWPELIVGTLFASCLILYLDPSDDPSGLLGYIGQIQGLIGSAMLILILVEALDGKWGAKKEREFRLAFAGGYLLIVAVSFIFDLPEFADWRLPAQAAMATLALTGATVAWRHRRRHPLPRTGGKQSKTATDPVLANSILRLLQEEHVYLDPAIKVAGLAAQLNTPDYKVSQCIVNDLGYQNFNRLMNAFRLEAAKLRLSQPAQAGSSILVIAMDCGFGSLGPFNRAFRAQTGKTPTAFRRTALAMSSKPGTVDE